MVENFEGAKQIPNKEKQSAVVRQLEIIGEAVKKLPREFTGKYPEIPWKDIAGMRDKLMHHYFGVDRKVVWNTIKKDIPILKEKLLAIREPGKTNGQH